MSLCNTNKNMLKRQTPRTSYTPQKPLFPYCSQHEARKKDFWSHTLIINDTLYKTLVKSAVMRCSMRVQDLPCMSPWDWNKHDALKKHLIQ